MIGIISDIHGNYPALQAVLNRLDQLGASRIICLGDVAGYYCLINECCETLRERDVFTLMGNHDWYLVSGTECPRSNSANKCLDYQRSVILPEHLQWLRSFPQQASVEGIALVHGGWNDPLDEYLKPCQSYFDALRGERFASGHSHVQILWEGDGKVYCNPGAVGQPRDGDPTAAFATFDGESFTLHRVAYDIARMQSAMRTAGFTDYFSENLSHGTQIGGRISAY
ncbi:TPA: metallophosphoesterase [Pseudomonas putida]